MFIGIDLGTTFSVAAYMDENGIPHIIPNRDGTNTMPSVVMFDQGEIIVGAQAKINAISEPDSVVQFAKQHIGTMNEFLIDDGSGEEKLYSPEDISAIILKRIRQDCEEFLGKEVTGAVITVPAYFTDAQKNSTIAAGKIAGLNVLKVIHEPTAAAMAYGLNKPGEHYLVLIYDLGGGTFDVTAAEINGKDITVRATHGQSQLGGFYFDNHLIGYSANQIKEVTGIDIHENGSIDDLQLLRQRCEDAKIALSTRQNYSFSFNLQGSKAKVELSRKQFEQLLLFDLETTGDSIDIVLEDGEISKDEIDKVLLVGGCSIIPMVGEYIHKKLGIKPSAEVNPHEIVAIGAAICANSFTGNNLIDRNAHPFGVVVRSKSTGDLVNSVIIPRNQPLLKPFVKVYSSMVDNQEEIHIRVTEGENEDLRYVTIIGESTIELNLHPEGSPIAIEFKYDDNGIISGKVFDLYDVPHEVDDDGYLVGEISSLDGPLFMANVNIKRENALSEEEIEAKQHKLKSLDIQ